MVKIKNITVHHENVDINKIPHLNELRMFISYWLAHYEKTKHEAHVYFIGDDWYFLDTVTDNLIPN